MSITFTSSHSSALVYDPQEAVQFRTSSHENTVVETSGGVVRAINRPPSGSQTQKPHERRPPLRRLQGFLVEDRGRESKVVFVQNEQCFEYFLPSALLRENEITLKNQPFEIDEMLLTSPSGETYVTYHVRPLAKASDAYPEPIELDAKRKERLALILSGSEDAET